MSSLLILAVLAWLLRRRTVSARGHLNQGPSPVTTYQKTAAFLLRLAGVLWVVFFAFMWGLYFIELAFGIDMQHYPVHTVIGNVGYIVLGIMLIVASKPRGRLIGSGLDV